MTFYRVDNKQNLLTVPDSFAQLNDVADNGDMSFVFTYSVDQSDVVKRSALVVNVTVASQFVKRDDVMDTSQPGFTDMPGFLVGVRTLLPTSKTVAKEQERYNIAIASSDIMAFINNENLQALANGAPASAIQNMSGVELKTVTVAELKQSNLTQPVLQIVAHPSVTDAELATSASIELNPQLVMSDMVTRQGVDPSTITTMTPRTISAMSSVGGLLRPTLTNELTTDPASSLLNSYVYSPLADPTTTTTAGSPDDTVVHVLSPVVNDTLDIPVDVFITQKSLTTVDGVDVSHLLVRFDLIDTTTFAVVDSVTKTLNVTKHVQLFYTPKTAPTMQVSGIHPNGSYVTLNVEQTDKSATAVNIYKKVLSRTDIDAPQYVFLGQYDSRNKQTLHILGDATNSTTEIFRAVSVGKQGTLGFDYTNVISRAPQTFQKKSLAVNAYVTNTGIDVEVRSIPTNVIAIQVLVRNLSIHQKEHQIVGDVVLIDDATRKLDRFSVTDVNVSDFNVYEYVANLIYQSGTTEQSGMSIIEYRLPNVGRVDVQINNLVVSHDTGAANVTFNISTTIIDSDIDVVFALLNRQDIKQFFNNDLQREREFLKSLIAHRILRFDLTAGVCEDFGILTSNVFNDATLAKNNGVSALVYGHKYRYEAHVLLRDAETMFETFVKNNVDPVTNKPYKFNPAKFRHPVTLRNGTLVSSMGLKFLYSQDPMSHGDVGSFAAVDVSLDDSLVTITNPEATKFNERLNVVTWKVDGPLELIDHFLIIKDVFGVRSLVGKAHSEFPFGNAQFLHVTTDHDKGAFKYVILPIFNDYKVGQEVTTNLVTV